MLPIPEETLDDTPVNQKKLKKKFLLQKQLPVTKQSVREDIQNVYS